VKRKKEGKRKRKSGQIKSFWWSHSALSLNQFLHMDLMSTFLDDFAVKGGYYTNNYTWKTFKPVWKLYFFLMNTDRDLVLEMWVQIPFRP
jgi:hypothetical protein